MLIKPVSSLDIHMCVFILIIYPKLSQADKYVMQTYNNIGYHLHPLTEQELKPIWDEIDQVTPDFGPNTVNHKAELNNCRSHVEAVVMQQIIEYNHAFNWPNRLRVLDRPVNLKLSQLWVNWMGKYEASPIHNHEGVMSFVIWMRVPYTHEEEVLARPHVPPHLNFGGEFALHYTDTLGQIRSEFLPILDSALCLFPSGLNHSVFPYYSTDSIRVSIAGNFMFDPGP